MGVIVFCLWGINFFVGLMFFVLLVSIGLFIIFFVFVVFGIGVILFVKKFLLEIKGFIFEELE